MLTLQLGHARISKPEVLSKFKGGGGGDEPETLRHHPRQYIFMIGFSFITPTLTAWDRSKLQLLINLQTNERKICPQACGFVPRLTQWARGMIIPFSPQWARRLEKKGKRKGLRHACSDSKRWPPSSKATGTQLLGRARVVGWFFFFFFFFPFPFSFFLFVPLFSG
jgi:hypothetical protein